MCHGWGASQDHLLHIAEWTHGAYPTADAGRITFADRGEPRATGGIITRAQLLANQLHFGMVSLCPAHFWGPTHRGVFILGRVLLCPSHPRHGTC